jgi:tripartite-type tricarboxylate transporter receptor subunit TctC
MMRIARRRFLQLAAAGAVLPALSPAAWGQGYPSRPLRLVVPYPAGGSIDLIARLIGQWLSERLGQPVVIDNRPGGGTNIGVQAVVTAPPDGYTLLLIVSTNATNVSLYKSLPFDFQRDIVPVAGLAELPLLLVANPAVPARTVAEFIAHAKANPGKVNVGSFGARTIAHLAIELLRQSAGLDIVHVPYRGGAPLMTDLIAGRVDAGVDALPNALPHIQRGAARALAVLPADRTPLLPEVPTVGETLPGYEVSTWSGIGVPRGTPAEIVARLNREINAGLDDAAIRKRIAEVGGTPLRFSAEEFRQRIDADVVKWADVIRRAGIAPE